MNLENPDSPNCLNCGLALEGKFCHNCGEKQINAKDKSLLFILGEFFSALTFFDNKLLRTVWTLLRWPGRLTKEYNLGIRKRYTKPISLFFLINILIFLTDLGSVFDSPFHIQMENLPHSDWAKSIVEAKIDILAIEYSEYEKNYNVLSNTVSKTAIFLIIPILALFVMLINLRKRQYYLDHFVFSLHGFAYALLYVMLFLIMGISIIAKLLNSRNLAKLINDPYVVFLLAGTIVPYFILSGKTNYGDSWMVSILKGFLYFVGLIISVTIFRLILFVIVYNLL